MRGSRAISAPPTSRCSKTSSKHVDLSAFDEGKVLNLVIGYCRANPDKKPVTAIDELIRKSTKVKAKWESGTIDWDG